MKLNAESALALLSTPRETLKIFLDVRSHPKEPPVKACKALSVSGHTWYKATLKLERLGLIFLDRAPGGKKVQNIRLTQRGRGAGLLLDGLADVLGGTPGALEWLLENAPPLYGSREAGEALCALVTWAEKVGDWDELTNLVMLAKKLKRPGEAALAASLVAFHNGHDVSAREASKAALRELAAAPDCESYRRALFVESAVSAHLGDHVEAYRGFTRLRKLALDAHDDDAAEADARLGIGNVKADRGSLDGAKKELERALASARRSGVNSKVTKVLTSLAFVETLLEPGAGLVRADEALVQARKSGALVLQVHVELNRALALAFLQEKAGSRRAFEHAEQLATRAHYERGAESLQRWGALVREISLHHRREDPSYWTGRVLRLFRSQPTREPEGPPAQP